jgi:hypothetical protein
MIVTFLPAAKHQSRHNVFDMNRGHNYVAGKMSSCSGPHIDYCNPTCNRVRTNTRVGSTHEYLRAYSVPLNTDNERMYKLHTLAA